jgi:hypothetical protein
MLAGKELCGEMVDSGEKRPEEVVWWVVVWGDEDGRWWTMGEASSFSPMAGKPAKRESVGKFQREGRAFFFFSFFFFGGGFLIIQGSAWIIAFMHITGINFWKPPNYCEPDLPWKD